MTWFLCLASFAAGYLVRWATSRHQVAQTKRNAMLLVHSRHAAEADLATAIRDAEGAGL